MNLTIAISVGFRLKGKAEEVSFDTRVPFPVPVSAGVFDKDDGIEQVRESVNRKDEGYENWMSGCEYRASM